MRWRKRVDGRAKNRSSATTAARGGEAKLYHRKGEKENHTVLCHNRSGRNTQNAPGPVGGRWIGRTKKKRTRKTYSPVPQFSGPITQTMPWPRTRRGSTGQKNAGTTPKPTRSCKKHPKTQPKNSETVSCAATERPDYPDQPRHRAGVVGRTA